MSNGLNAQRLPRSGRNDVGDAYVPGVNGSYVVEAKAPRRDGRIDLSGWLREADTEADNYMTIDYKCSIFKECWILIQKKIQKKTL